MADEPTRTLPPNGSAADRPVLDATRDEHDPTADPSDTPATSAKPDGPPGYELLELVGSGGMGIVYRAKEIALDRDVAVKLLQDRYPADSPAARRFIGEARITGQLQHPAIPPVHHVSALPDGRPFLVMKLIKGDTLDDSLAKEPTNRARFVAVFAQVCQALAYAHERKVIHRDLKPSNVMVGAFGEVQVMDWGVAKVLTGLERECTAPTEVDDERTAIHAMRDGELITQAGSVLGTPAYMAPEQAQGAVEEIDERSDVFGLGAVLCTILTGKPPYSGAGADSVRLKAIRGETADALARLDACGADPELVALAKRCLAREREARPRDAGEVAAAVTAHLAAAEERARKAELDRVRTEEERKRRRVQLTLAAAVLGLVALASVGTVVAFLWQRAEGAKEAAESARGDAEIARDLTEQARAAEADAKGRVQGLLELESRLRGNLETALKAEQTAKSNEENLKEKLARQEYARTVDLAHREWRDNNVTRARELLASCREDFRGWEWHYVHRLCHGDRVTMPGWETLNPSVFFTPDGDRVLIGGGLEAVVRDVRTGRVLQKFNVRGKDKAVALSPDGKKIAATGAENTVVISELEGGKKLQTLVGPPGSPFALAFNQDGSRIAVGYQDGPIKIWDSKTGRELVTLDHKGGSVWSLAFNRDGSRLVTAYYSGLDADVWDTTTGKLAMKLIGHGYSPTASYIGNLPLPEPLGGRPFTAGAWMREAAYSPDGSRLVTAGGDGTARIWDATTGKEILTLRNPRGVATAAFSPDGTRVVTGGSDGVVKVWDVKPRPPVKPFDRDTIRIPLVQRTQPGDELATFNGHVGPVLAAAFSPDGSRLVTLGDDHTVRVWDAAGVEVRTPKGNATYVHWATFSPDGSRLITTTWDKAVSVWDVETGDPVRSISELRGPEAWWYTTPPVSNRDGSAVVVGRSDHKAVVLDLKTGKTLLTLDVPKTRDISAVAWSPDGTRLATGGEEETQVWDARTGKTLLILEGLARSVEWNRDGSRILTASDGGRVKLWDAKSGKNLLTIETRQDIGLLVFPPSGFPDLTASFSPDGSRILTAGAEGAAKIWDASTGKELLTLKGHTAAIGQASWNPTGDRIVTGSADTTAKIWDATTGAELLTLRKHTGWVYSAAWSPGGTRIVTTSRDGQVLIWESTPVNREFLPRDAPPPREVKRP
jgi:WD40 repeat protein/serine/threonine protein kinase